MLDVVSWPAAVSVQYPAYIFTSSTFVLGLGLTAVPDLVPVVLLVSALHLYSRIIRPRERALSRFLALWALLSVATTVAQLGPSLKALSSAPASIFSAYALSLAKNFLAISTIYLDTVISSRSPISYTHFTFFPIFWATIWTCIGYASPVGRLLGWTPITGVERYEWLIPFFGSAINDWVAAAWAVVISGAVSNWLMGSTPAFEHEEEDYTSDQLIDHPNGYSPRASRVASKKRQPLTFAAFLVVLTIPSFVQSPLPYPPYSPNTTPLTVGCLLPGSIKSKHLHLTLDDYIQETKRYNGQADILLWPESAVRFDNPGDRDAAIAQIRKVATGSWIGVSFEDTTHDLQDPARKTALRRNGVALVHNKSDTQFEYFKQHLVPVAESFSLRHSTDPPTIFEIPLSPPKGISKPDWGTPPRFTRPVPITASICLDFAFPNAFSSLESKPALILAPGRTWHPDVGTAMFQQARLRALEVGSALLWCDGGRDAAENRALSGVVGPGLREPFQSGRGTWIKTIGVTYPFDDGRRTVYARLGSFGSLSLIWAVTLGGMGAGRLIERRRGTIIPVSRLWATTGGVARGFVTWVRERVRARGPEEERDLLE